MQSSKACTSNKLISEKSFLNKLTPEIEKMILELHSKYKINRNVGIVLLGIAKFEEVEDYFETPDFFQLWNFCEEDVEKDMISHIQKMDYEQLEFMYNYNRVRKSPYISARLTRLYDHVLIRMMNLKGQYIDIKGIHNQSALVSQELLETMLKYAKQYSKIKFVYKNALVGSQLQRQAILRMLELKPNAIFILNPGIKTDRMVSEIAQIRNHLNGTSKHQHATQGVQKQLGGVLSIISKNEQMAGDTN